MDNQDSAVIQGVEAPNVGLVEDGPSAPAADNENLVEDGPGAAAADNKNLSDNERRIRERKLGDEEYKVCKSECTIESNRHEWEIKDFRQLPLQEHKLYESKSFFWFGALWKFIFEARNVSLNNWSRLAVTVKAEDHPLRVTIGAYLRCSGDTLYVTENTTTIDINQEKMRRNLTFTLAGDIDRKNELFNKMRGMSSDLWISCCLIAREPDETLLPPDTEKLVFWPIEWMKNEKEFDVKELILKEMTKILVKVEDKLFSVEEDFFKKISDTFNAHKGRLTKVDRQEDRTEMYELNGVKKEVFEDYLLYFNGSVEKLNLNSLVHLYIFAHTYNDEVCKTACLTYIVREIPETRYAESEISTGNAESEIFMGNAESEISMRNTKLSALIEFAEKYKEDYLMQHLASYIAINTFSILCSQDWKNFERRNTSLAIKVTKMALKYNSIKLKL